MSPVLSQLEALFNGEDLTQQAMADIMAQVVSGELDPILLSSLLTALKIKGETANEIAGAAQGLATHAAPFPHPDYPFADIVGTGGDGHNTINISSAAAVVAASCGVKVAKHGNRSVSSKSGSADLFEAFGMDINMSAETARACLDQAGLCFLYAPIYHAGVKQAATVRQTLKTRTIFNLMGPLINPARPSHITIGVYTPELVRPYAETLKLLGYDKALVVHGSGLDELALHGPSQVAELKGTDIREYQLTPADFGLDSYGLDAIAGGDPDQNKGLVEAVLSGRGQPAHRAAIAMNTGALLYLTDIATNVADGTAKALEAIDSGKPMQIIEEAATISRGNR